VKHRELEAIDFDINLAPDMFPVLCVLSAHAKGRSRYIGGEQLKYKESDRLKTLIELLQKMNKKFEIKEGFFEIEGETSIHNSEFEFDCREDHRLAMAAGLVKYLGYNIKIINPQVVSKSFPKFWDIVGSAL
jgi:3-phosphoshikimate 1-carboxyvinyltransferase